VRGYSTQWTVIVDCIVLHYILYMHIWHLRIRASSVQFRASKINMALARMDKLVKKLNVEPWVWITPGAAPLRWMEPNHNPRWNISGLRVTLSYLGEKVRVASMSNLFFNLYLVFLNGVPLPCMARGTLVTVKSC
jgi:hypothetical protein